MRPNVALRLELGTLLAADPATLAPAVNGNKIALVMQPFVPTEDLIATDLTYATFTGSTPIQGSTGAQLTGVDPATGEQVLTIKAPLGGWRWHTTATTNLPETIYGFALLDSTLASLYAVQLLPTPIALTESGQEIDLGAVTITFVLQPMN
jgi:hypothetical protein